MWKPWSGERGDEGIATNASAITNDFYDSCAMPDLFVSGTRRTATDVRWLEHSGAAQAMGRNVIDLEVAGREDTVLRVYAPKMPAALNEPVIMRGSGDVVGIPAGV